MFEKKRLFKTLEPKMRHKGLSNLANETSFSRQALYDMMNKQNPRLDTFLEVAKKLGLEVKLEESNNPSLDDVLSLFTQIGVPVSAPKTQRELSTEEALAWGVLHSRENALLASLLPYALHLVIEGVDLAKLVSLTSDLNEARALGYFAEVANAFRPHPRLNMLFELMYTPPSAKLEPLDRGDKVTDRRLKHYAAVDNPPAKRWGFFLLDDLQHHLDRYAKWEHSAQERTTHDKQSRNPSAS